MPRPWTSLPGSGPPPTSTRDSGSLGGIFTGLSAARGDYGIVVACDMPFLNTELLGFMLDIAPDYDVVVPRLNGRPEPLHAIYSKSCLEPIEQRLKRNDLKIALFFEEVRVAFVEEDDVDLIDPHHLSFFNVNTQEDLGQGPGPRGASLAGRRLDSSGPGTRE